RPARAARPAAVRRCVAGAGPGGGRGPQARRAGAGPGGRLRIPLHPPPALAVLAGPAGVAGGMTPSRRIRRRRVEATPGWPDRVPPLLRRVYAARGVTDPALALPRLAHLPPPDSLLGVDTAVELLAEAIAGGRRILVVADF